jgi:hypothetical protein
MINLTNILEFLFGKKKNMPAVNENTLPVYNTAPGDTVGYVIVVDTLPPAEEAQVNCIYVLRTDNELWIVYEGSDEWTSVVSWDVYDDEEAAEAASLLYPYKICFSMPEETVK